VARAATYRIDPTASFVRLSGSVRAFGLNFNLNYQTLGSMEAPCAGMLRLERSGDSLEILGGAIEFHDTGSWEPGFFGVPGSAPANYGARSGSDLGGLRILGLTAVRQCAITLGPTNLAMTNLAFAARRIPLHFSEAGPPLVDYRFLLFIRNVDPDAIPPGLPHFPSLEEPRTVAAGRTNLTGQLSNRATNTGRFLVEHEIETLVIPFSARHQFTARASSGDQFNYDLFLEGELRAIPLPMVSIERASGPAGALRLSWPGGFRLQRSVTALLGGWSDHADDPPYEVSASSPREYFRAVKSANP